MSARLRLLLISDQVSPATLSRSAWRHLLRHASLELLPLRKLSLVARGDYGAGDLLQQLTSFDYLLGHADLFPLMFRLRQKGLATPFAIVPDYNHVDNLPLLDLFLASQVTDGRDVLFTGSAAAAKSFAAFGFSTEAFYPLGVPLNFFTPAAARQAVRGRLSLSPETFAMLHAGRLQEDKAVLELIEAFGRIAGKAGCVLLLAYHIWDDDYRQACRRLAAKTGNVRFFERPSIMRLRSLYRATDLFVSVATSRYETFGRAVVEAMGCGAVPVVPRYDGFAETVTPDAGYLLPLTGPPEQRLCDRQAFVRTVESLLHAPARVRQHALRTRQSIQFLDEQSTTERAFRALAKRSRPHGTPVLEARINLSRYPEPVRARMMHLDGMAFEAFATPIDTIDRAPAAAQRDRAFRAFWFGHY